MDLKELAHKAADCLLEQRPVTITHEPGWKREGFPLPMKRMAASADGSITQDYRPLAVLEYVHEVLSGELAARRTAKRHQDARMAA